jgi:hypothetical protein
MRQKLALVTTAPPSVSLRRMKGVFASQDQPVRIKG